MAKQKPDSGSGEPYALMPVAELVNDPRNARRHGQRNLDAVVESLRRFGLQKPIVVGADGVVLAGNATLQAAKALGWTEIAVMRSKLTGAEAAAFAVADNRTAELAEWDSAVLEELAKEVDLTQFFTEGELQALAGSWELPEAELRDLEAQQDAEQAGATIKVRCSAGDRDDVLEALREAVAPFAGAVVE